jgi:Family of unknown function (DUF6510)
MDVETADVNTELMVDGNAVAGELELIFGHDMTKAVARCASCAAQSMLANLMAFVRGPGAVLRCPSCEAVIARIVETPTATYLDTHGAMYLRITHS